MISLQGTELHFVDCQSHRDDSKMYLFDSTWNINFLLWLKPAFTKKSFLSVQCATIAAIGHTLFSFSPFFSNVRCLLSNVRCPMSVMCVRTQRKLAYER